MCGCLTAPRMQHLDGPGISSRGGLNSATGTGQDGNAGEGGMEGEKSPRVWLLAARPKMISKLPKAQESWTEAEVQFPQSSQLLMLSSIIQ